MLDILWESSTKMIFWYRVDSFSPLVAHAYLFSTDMGLYHGCIFITFSWKLYMFPPLALMSDCVISEWELYSVIFQCLCRLGLLQMILYLLFWQFFGPCWRNFLCLDTWRMVIYPLQLAGLFHKQFNLQVWQKICNFGFLDRLWDLSTEYIYSTWFCLTCRPALYSTAQSTSLPFNKLFVIPKSWLLHQNR